MADDEFDEVARATAREVRDDDLEERIAAACRGSGNPAALAWLATGLGLGASSTVVDLGSGLGGPAAWIATRHRCAVVAMEPAAGGAEGADALFPIPVVRGSADRTPFRSASFDAALLLGVISVVERPLDVLAEAGRVALDVGIMDYVSTGSDATEAGGSRFATRDELEEWLPASGLAVLDRTTHLPDPPEGWREAAASVDHVVDAHPAAAESEREVVRAIETGALAPILIRARRA